MPSKHRKNASPEKLAVDRRALLVEAAELVSQMALPISQKLRESTVPESLVIRLAGGRRLSTVRKHMRAIRQLVRWSRTMFQRSMPIDWTGYGLYIEGLARERCGPSVPGSILKAVDFIEMIGGVREQARIRRDPNLVQIVSDFTVELKTGTSRAKRKSPPQTLAALVSSELAVVDTTKPIYARLHNWTNLLRHWGALRWDDLLHAPPRLARFTSEGLTITVIQTKTTGPGKKVENLLVYVSSEAYLFAPGWLEVGWRLFKEIGPKNRDFWLPLPDSFMEAFSEHAPKYQDALNMARQEMKELVAGMATQLSGGVLYDYMVDADGDPELLFESLIQLSWKLHGDRATIVNWVLVMGYGKETRESVSYTHLTLPTIYSV